MTHKAAKDLLELVNSVIEGKMLFLGRTTNDTFSIIKTLDNNTGINLFEGQTLKLTESYCQQIFLGNREPLIINDARNHPFTSMLSITNDLNIQSYIGVPIFYKDGEMFGTLCALDCNTSTYTQKDVETLVKFSNIFTYVIELEKQMKIDSLTNLYNRSYLHDNFEFIADHGTLMLLDLDGFKQVNDNFGHDVGDLVLIEISNRIKQMISSRDLAVRLGGDEFVLLFPNQSNLHLIENLGENLVKQLSEWQNFEYPIQVSASIGIVQFPQDGNELRTLMKKADTAMYKAKVNGKSTYCHYHSFDR
ncbi:sensor domain-containing diguanylate cyclase [Alkalihalobacterium alkalinitrilicum]|uniref:sensor domain-containing diguanylate cyclase n=1 Tax=Alkalihalobacterium alkalinitrilicum TaxID=427920 RepID=UPI000995217B|nr:sensor domain-containing diguanylate cyclase [Alkalihalobacterium alkalinitrilicum]